MKKGMKNSMKFYMNFYMKFVKSPALKQIKNSLEDCFLLFINMKFPPSKNSTTNFTLRFLVYKLFQVLISFAVFTHDCFRLCNMIFPGIRNMMLRLRNHKTIQMNNIFRTNTFDFILIFFPAHPFAYLRWCDCISVTESKYL